MTIIGRVTVDRGATVHLTEVALTLKAPITTAADDSLEYFFIVFFFLIK